MRKVAITAAAIGLIIALYVGTRRHAGDVKAVAVPHSAAAMAPALTMVDLGGNKIETASYRGKVVLINFWAAWCTPCAQEIPQFVAFQDKYRGQGFQAIGISMEDQEIAPSSLMHTPITPAKAAGITWHPARAAMSSGRALGTRPRSSCWNTGRSSTSTAIACRCTLQATSWARPRCGSSTGDT